MQITQEAPVVILVGGQSSRLYSLLGWPTMLTNGATIGNKILSRFGRAGNMIDAAVTRWQRPTFLVCPESYKKFFLEATRNYHHVKIVTEPDPGSGTGGAIQLIADYLKERGFQSMYVLYGDAWVSSADTLKQVFQVAEDKLYNSAAKVGMVLLEQRSFNPGLGYCKYQNGFVSDMIEKPNSPDLVAGYYLNPAFYVIKTDTFDEFDFQKPYSFEESVLPNLINSRLVLAVISQYCHWADLGTPKEYAEKRFPLIDGNRLGLRAREVRSTNVILHCELPGYALWVEGVHNALISIVPLAYNDLGALVVLPASWHEQDPRAVASMMKNLRRKVVESETNYCLYHIAAPDEELIPIKDQCLLGEDLVVLLAGEFSTPSSLRITRDRAVELNLPQITIKG